MRSMLTMEKENNGNGYPKKKTALLETKASLMGFKVQSSELPTVRTS